MDKEKRKEIMDAAHLATCEFIVGHLDMLGCKDDDSPEVDQTLHAVFTGLLSGAMWTMAGAWGSRPALSFTMACLTDYVDRMMPVADAKHAEIAARAEEEQAAQQAELAAAQEAESGGEQP